jgi:hypothetical protein
MCGKLGAPSPYSLHRVDFGAIGTATCTRDLSSYDNVAETSFSLEDELEWIRQTTCPSIPHVSVMIFVPLLLLVYATALYDFFYDTRARL